MTLSRTSLVDRAYLRNLSRGVTVPHGRYDAMVSQALEQMADNYANDPDERVRAQLRKDFNLGFAAGSGSLTPLITASEPFLDHAISTATITSSDSGYPWQYLPSYEELTLRRPTFGLIFYTVKSGNVVATDTGGSLGTLNTTATVSGNYVPQPSSISGNLDLEESAINALADLIAGITDAVQTAAEPK